MKHSDLLQEPLRGQKAIPGVDDEANPEIQTPFQSSQRHRQFCGNRRRSGNVGTVRRQPVALDYHFVIKSDKIPPLTIEWSSNMTRLLDA